MTATGSPLRFAVWALHLSLPVLGLWLLLARPQIDAALHWQHNPSHFALMLLAAIQIAPRLVRLDSCCHVRERHEETRDLLGALLHEGAQAERLSLHAELEHADALHPAQRPGRGGHLEDRPLVGKVQAFGVLGAGPQGQVRDVLRGVAPAPHAGPTGRPSTPGPRASRAATS